MIGVLICLLMLLGAAFLKAHYKACKANYDVCQRDIEIELLHRKIAAIESASVFMEKIRDRRDIDNMLSEVENNFNGGDND